jgi:hypothetical protein
MLPLPDVVTRIPLGSCVGGGGRFAGGSGASPVRLTHPVLKNQPADTRDPLPPAWPLPWSSTHTTFPIADHLRPPGRGESADKYQATATDGALAWGRG